MIIHFSSVHTLILKLRIDVVEMEFLKLLGKMEMSINNYPSCIRTVEAVIRTVRVVPAIGEGSDRIWESPSRRDGVPGGGEYPAGPVNP